MKPNSHTHHLGQMRKYVLALMDRDKRDFTRCEYCSKDIVDGRWELHHTRYEGATYKDMMIVCRSCNRLAENVGLA